MSAIVRLGPAYIGLAVDGSGSMKGVAGDVVEGVNQQGRTLLDTATDRTFLSVKVFADEVHPLFQGEIPRFRGISTETYRPDGNTALLDAWGALLDEMEPQVEDPRHGVSPATGLVVAFTDGQENVSRDYGPPSSPAHLGLLGRIHRLAATGRWTFCVVGPAAGLADTCELLGVPLGNARPFNPNDASWARDSFDASSASLTGYMDARSRGIGSSEEFFGSAGTLPPRGRR